MTAQTTETALEKMTRITIRNLEATIEHAEENNAKFIERLQKDPMNALSWSLGEFQTQAKAVVARDALRGLNRIPASGSEPVTLRNLRDYALKQALRSAQFPAASTSTTSNLAEQWVGAAWAQLAEDLTFELEDLDEA